MLAFAESAIECPGPSRQYLGDASSASHVMHQEVWPGILHELSHFKLQAKYMLQALHHCPGGQGWLAKAEIRLSLHTVVWAGNWHVYVANKESHPQGIP